MEYSTESTIRRIVLTAILVFVIPAERLCPSPERTGSARAFSDGKIECVLDTGDDMYSRSGLKAGFNYELLHRYAENAGCLISITAAEDGENYIDSLNCGKIDILVRLSADSLDNPLIRRSRNVDHYCAWYLRADRTAEMKDINLWLNSFIGTRDYTDLQYRFYTSYDPFRRLERGTISGTISPYDNLIKKHADILDWDWRLLAAIIYQESRFSISTSSSRGATGLMQVMPSTAGYYGITDLLDPEQNLIAGTRHLARIQESFSEERFTDTERINFTLAAYNAGEKRITDCRIFAMQKELDNTKWEEVVKIIPDMRKYSFVYNDTIRSGRFRGTETINYVSRIMDIYDAFREICPES